jgi:small subunit ribosomal protein S6
VKSLASYHKKYFNFVVLSPQGGVNMEKVINSYETLFVVDCALGEEGVKSIVDKFTALIGDNATIENVDEWGKRRLAYPINDKNDGYYVLVNFKSEGAFTSELERVFGITEGILRSIVIRHIEDKKTKKEA